jgi:hypothetical protein
VQFGQLIIYLSLSFRKIQNLQQRIMAETLKLATVIENEKQQLRLRRAKLNIQNASSDGAENWFGIAMSGGGIRSATINLGFLKTLNRFGILEKADYLSSVSGGGYCGSYVQSTLKAEKGNYATLFDDAKMTAVRNHGEYMIPGNGLKKKWNQLLLIVAYLVSTIMSFVSPAIVIFMGIFLYKILGIFLQLDNALLVLKPSYDLLTTSTYVIAGIIVIHFFSNILLNFNLDISKKFNYIENVLVLASLIIGFLWLVSEYKGVAAIGKMSAAQHFVAASLLFVLGYTTNPNAISFHRYYRKQLADCFLQFGGVWHNAPLKDFFNMETPDNLGYIAPYPLINTCLNLQAPNGKDKFKGSKASDYFLLSPLYCGSKLTEYVPTNTYTDYSGMTLPAAVTVSAAAVNPGMGIYSSPILSVFMTIFNARLGFWISNPLKVQKRKTIVWWPLYFFKELLSSIGTNNNMVNISDGGHIENLAVYELLRRRCRLILAVDGGEDPLYTFADLENLVIRARNELGIDIRFRPNEEPETLIRPRPSTGYSIQRFAVADLYLLWRDDKVESDKLIETPHKFGTLVYIKSSVTAPMGKLHITQEEDPMKYDTYKYKIYHPVFPHEPTSDQFFDPIQWESYYQLGQFVGADILGLKDDPNKFDYNSAPKFSVENLVNHFDNDEILFKIKEEAVAVEPNIVGQPVLGDFEQPKPVDITEDKGNSGAYRM